jgi:predicted XRE-type DNA-binding protein
MNKITPRLADAKRALDAADRARADGQAMVDQGRALAKQGTERIRQADPQYWTAARLVFDELTQTPVTQQQAAIVLGRSRSYVSKLYSVGKAFTGRDPAREGLSFDAAYRQSQEVSDYGIGREKISGALDGPSLTQSQLAEHTGLAQSTISEYLTEMIREGTVCKGTGRPARYELAPAPSPVRDEHPINDGSDLGGQDGEDRASADQGEATDRLGRGESVPGGPGACARPGCGHAKVQHNAGNRVRECERCDCPGWISEMPAADPEPEPELRDEEGRRRLDVQEILRFVERRVHREIQSRRLVPTPDEARLLIDELSAAITALRDQATITIVPPDQIPDPATVSEALKGLARQLRWASTAGQHSYFTDGATVWVVIASTRCAIVRARNGKVTAHPSDVTAHWLLTRATS